MVNAMCEYDELEIVEIKCEPIDELELYREIFKEIIEVINA